MYRGTNTNRGARRGGRGGSRGGRGGNRGGYRNASHGNNSRNSTNVANRSDTSTFNGPGRSKVGLMGGCFLPKHIFSYFNPSVADFDRNLMSSLNSGKEKPDGVSFVIVHVQNQPQWMSENIIYVKSNLHLLPQYTEKKSLLLERHEETGHEELMERIAAELTQSIKFDRYGVEDGPDVEIFDEEGEITSLVLPGDWMPVNYESPKFASVDTPSVKYAPVSDDPIAVFAGYKSDSNSSGFKFVAWFLIEEIELFAANSLDLARKMHDKKWTSDISHEWAAVKLLRVEKGEPEWRPVPAIKRRPVTAQVSEESKLTPEVVEKMKEYLAAHEGEIAGPRNKDPGSIFGGDEVHEIQTGQPFDEVQEHKSQPHEGGSGDSGNEAVVADVGLVTNRCDDIVHDRVGNELEVKSEVKTEVVEVKDHKEDAKEDSVKDPKDGDGGTDKEAIPEIGNITTKATDQHDESIAFILLKDKEAVMENGKMLGEAAKVEVDGDVAIIEVSEEVAKSELTVEKMKGDEIAAEIPTIASEDGKVKEKKEKEEKEIKGDEITAEVLTIANDAETTKEGNEKKEEKEKEEDEARG